MPRNESTRSAGKRPMRAMTNRDKLDAIDRVRAGESKAAVARDIGVPESTLRGWCKAEPKIRLQEEANSRTSLTPTSSENSRNSVAGSSSRSTPTEITMGMSSCGAAERVNEESEAQTPGSAPKRQRLDNNLASPAAAAAINMNNINNMSTSARTPLVSDLSPALLNPALTPFLYNMFMNDENGALAATFSSFLAGGASSSHSGYLAPAANLLDSLPRNNGAMGSTMTMTMGNMLPTNNSNNIRQINGRRRYNALGHTSTELLPRTAARRQSNRSPNAERPSGRISQPTNNRSSPMPSTSANNGNNGGVTNNSTRSKDCRKLNAIIYQLQQQQGAERSVSECNMTEIISNNAMNNNNNNVDHVDNETTNRRTPNSLPPGFSETLTNCAKLIEWLQTYGSPICTFNQVTQIKTILENMTNWANSKENEPKRKSNGTS